MSKISTQLIQTLPKGIGGFSLFIIGLLLAFIYLPPITFDEHTTSIFFAFGFLAVWRYSWGLTHFIRALIYRKITFPQWRKKANKATTSTMPSKAYILITSYHIDTAISLKTVRSAIREAMRAGIPCAIYGCIGEKADENLYRTLFNNMKPPKEVTLHLVRMPGRGKRMTLAHGFRAISRDMPPRDAIVAVMDGDTELTTNSFKDCLPFFKIMPKIGALTTDELPKTDGSAWFKQWFNMRFAQRHILMSSLSLSKRVMTLTGRLSFYRASIVTDANFIDHMLSDNLDHWRLGKFKFLTGDDKSSLFWVLKEGWQQIYIPDIKIIAHETQPARYFTVASTKLMVRWFGNMLRTNERIVKLGIKQMPAFTWWSFIDQKLSMWTSLTGPIFAIMLSIHYTPVFFLYYLIWVGFIRMIMTFLLLSARHEVNWRYPFLLYYNQIYGALLKTYILFNLDKQKWTRQNIKMERGLSGSKRFLLRSESWALHGTAIITLLVTIGFMTETLILPRAITNFLY